MMFSRGSGALGRCFEYGINFMHSDWGLLMMGVAIFIIALIVVAIVVIMKKSRKAHVFDDGLSLLNERFAKGEISEEEYTRMKTVLRTK